MICPHCGSDKYRRADNHAPTPREGIVFRAHECLSSLCGRIFLSAQLVIVNESEPVERLDSVLKGLLDAADAAIGDDDGS